MHVLYRVDIGAQPIYIIQRPNIRISAILTVYISYLAADTEKQFVTIECAAIKAGDIEGGGLGVLPQAIQVTLRLGHIRA